MTLNRVESTLEKRATLHLQRGRYRAGRLAMPTGAPNGAEIIDTVVVPGSGSLICGITFFGTTVDLLYGHNVNVAECSFKDAMGTTTVPTRRLSLTTISDAGTSVSLPDRGLISRKSLSTISLKSVKQLIHISTTTGRADARSPLTATSSGAPLACPPKSVRWSRLAATSSIATTGLRISGTGGRLRRHDVDLRGVLGRADLPRQLPDCRQLYDCRQTSHHGVHDISSVEKAHFNGRFIS